MLHVPQPSWGRTVSTLVVESGEAGRGSRDDLVNQ